MKDNFSKQAPGYARYRPVYPRAFYDRVLSLVNERKSAWDCGTGNGQVALELARDFEKVWATDISEAQLKNAVPHARVSYSVQPAEKTNFPDHFFDLVVAAQAIHWFDFEKFYSEVKRTMKPNGLLVVVGYNRPRISAAVDRVVDALYTNTIGPYWDPERKYIEENYLTIPFPFVEIENLPLENVTTWTLEHLMGYLGSWSAVQHFIAAKGYDPIKKIEGALKEAWGAESKRKVSFPLLLRTGRIP